MKTLKLVAAIAAVLLSQFTASAARASGGDDHKHHEKKPVAAKTAGDTAGMSDAKVRKVDKDTKKITLKHGEIKNLEMPAMTMVFQVRDPALLGKVQQGDKVKFKAAMSGGAMVVTEIQVSK